MDIVDPQIEDYMASASARFDEPVLLEMEAERERGFPIVGRNVGVTLEVLARSVGARRIMELGSGFGYSAYWFARAMGPGASCTSPTATRRTERERWTSSGAGGLADGSRSTSATPCGTLARLAGEFDVVYCDIDKHGYPDAWREARERIRVGGLYVCDNVLWSGAWRAIEPRRRPATRRRSSSTTGSSPRTTASSRRSSPPATASWSRSGSPDAPAAPPAWLRPGLSDRAPPASASWAGTLASALASRARKTKSDFGTPYRGHEGQWSWLVHRVTGVAIILFLFAHVVDTAVVGWGPEAYNRVVSVYAEPDRPAAGAGAGRRRHLACAERAQDHADRLLPEPDQQDPAARVRHARVVHRRR